MSAARRRDADRSAPPARASRRDKSGADRSAAVHELLRAIVAPLPGVRETVTFGHPAWQAGKKTFAVLEEWRGRLTVAVKCQPLDAREWIETQPQRFFETPYSGKHGWVSLIVDGRVPKRLLAKIVVESFGLVAPR